MATYNIYGIGAALVDTEVEVSDTFLASAQIDKGVMTLVDEPRQSELLAALASENTHKLIRYQRNGIARLSRAVRQG